MLSLYRAIVEIKKRNKWSNVEIAAYCGVTPATVSRWRNGQVKTTSPDILKKLNDLLNRDEESIVTSPEERSCMKPVLGEVKAGFGGYALQLAGEYIQVSEEDDKRGDYFLRVTGNSMVGAGILDGDLLFVKKVSDVPSGTIAIVVDSNDEGTVKTVRKYPGYMVLEAANPEIPSKVITAEDMAVNPVHIIGRVLYSRRDL